MDSAGNLQANGAELFPAQRLAQKSSTFSAAVALGAMNILILDYLFFR